MNPELVATTDATDSQAAPQPLDPDEVRAHGGEAEGGAPQSMAQSCVSRILVIAGSSPEGVRQAVGTIAKAIPESGVDELHVIAASAQAHSLRAALLSSRDDLLASLQSGRGDVLFGSRTIHGVGNGARQFDVAGAADDMMRLLRSLSHDSGAELVIVVSADAVAIGLLLHAVLQLIARPGDRIAAVQGIPRPQPRTGRFGKQRTTTYQSLVELPLVLAENAPSLDVSFSWIVANRLSARRHLLQPAPVIVHTRKRLVQIGETEIEFPRLQFFWLCTIAGLSPTPFPHRQLASALKFDDRGRYSIPAVGNERDHLEAIMEHARVVFAFTCPESVDQFGEIMKRALLDPSPGLPPVIAKINARIKKALGLGAAPYVISGGRGSDGYRFTLPASRVRIDLPLRYQAY